MKKDIAQEIIVQEQRAEDYKLWREGKKRVLEELKEEEKEPHRTK